MSEGNSANEAAQITAGSRSNLALSFVVMSPERRADITAFYAFCRVVDDIADAPEVPVEEKQRQLEAWKRALFGASEGEPSLAPLVRELIAKYHLRENHLLEIIAGVEMDLTPRRYETFLDLRLYCYRVASVVGLVSIEIFGYRDDGCKRYATELGLALQLTNILRDVGEDFANGRRIYLPLEDLARFKIREEEFPIKSTDRRWQELMRFEVARAHEFYAAAEAALPLVDRSSMAPAEVMSRIYRRLLRKMERGNFANWEQRYKLSKLEKLRAILPVLASAWWKRRQTST